MLETNINSPNITNMLAQISVTPPHPSLIRRNALRAQLVDRVMILIGTEASFSTSIPGVTLYRYVAPTVPDPVTYEPSIAVVLQGKKRVMLGHTRFDYDASHFLLTSIDLPVTSQVVEASPETPYLCIRLKFDIGVVREMLGGASGVTAGTNSSAPGMTTSETTTEMLDAIARLIDLQNVPDEIAFMGALIEREIIFRVLQSPEGQRLRAIATLGDNSQRTAKAVEWIRDHFKEPLRMEELAQVACMGVSTLHHHFRIVTSMTPLQYQKKLRLHEARRRMLTDGMDAASAGFEVGYESASQFNREYSRAFGKPPLRDVRSLLAVAGGPVR
jgi:AraC-like DNA-binding protein